MGDDRMGDWVQALRQKFSNAMVFLKTAAMAIAGTNDPSSCEHFAESTDSVSKDLAEVAAALSRLPDHIIHTVMSAAIKKVGGLGNAIQLTPEQLHPLVVVGGKDVGTGQEALHLSIKTPSERHKDGSPCLIDVLSQNPDPRLQRLHISFSRNHGRNFFCPAGFENPPVIDSSALQQVFQGCFQLTSLSIECNTTALRNVCESGILTQLKDLCVFGCETAAGPIRELVHVIQSAAGCLESLQLTFPDSCHPCYMGEGGQHVFAALNACTSLTRLELQMPCALEYQDQLVAMPKLKEMVLNVWMFSASPLTSSGKHSVLLPARFCCPALESLRLGVSAMHLYQTDAAQDMPAAGATKPYSPMFPALKSLVIYRMEWPESFHSNASKEFELSRRRALAALLRETPRVCLPQLCHCSCLNRLGLLPAIPSDIRFCHGDDACVKGQAMPVPKHSHARPLYVHARVHLCMYATPHVHVRTTVCGAMLSVWVLRSWRPLGASCVRVGPALVQGLCITWLVEL